jgi:hypothetical protein
MSNIVPYTLQTMMGLKRNGNSAVHCVEIGSRSDHVKIFEKRQHRHPLLLVSPHIADAAQPYNKRCIRHVNKSKIDAESCLF